MNKLGNPLVLIVLGLVLGVGTSVFLFTSAAKPLIAAAKQSKVVSHEPVKPEAPWDFWTVEMENLASELKDSKAALKKREDDITAREQRFASERQELAKQRQQIEALRTDIAGRLIEIQSEEMKNFKSLATTYSALTPRAAISIFKEMDDASVVKILSLMKTDVAGPIFEEMGKLGASDPTVARRAAQISEKLRFLKSPRTP